MTFKNRKKMRKHWDECRKKMRKHWRQRRTKPPNQIRDTMCCIQKSSHSSSSGSELFSNSNANHSSVSSTAQKKTQLNLNNNTTIQRHHNTLIPSLPPIQRSQPFHKSKANQLTQLQRYPWTLLSPAKLHFQPKIKISRSQAYEEPRHPRTKTRLTIFRHRRA